MKPILLKCYLAKFGDERNSLLLTSDKLYVVFKGSAVDFEYNQIKSIAVSPKKLIIPLVLGGIGTSFTMLALSMNWYHYQLNLFFVFLSFGIMYYGFLGRDAVVISEKSQQHLFLINANKVIVEEFVSFVKERLWKLNRINQEFIFHIANKKHWDEQQLGYAYSHPSLSEEGFIHCSTRETLESTYQSYFNPSDDLVLLAIHPKWLLEETKWEQSSSSNNMYPHVYGEINKSAIIWAEKLSGENNLRTGLDSFR